VISTQDEPVLLCHKSKAYRACEDVPGSLVNPCKPSQKLYRKGTPETHDFSRGLGLAAANLFIEAKIDENRLLPYKPRQQSPVAD